MASGVKVNKACTDEFEKLKMQKQYRYIIYKLSDNMKEVVVDCVSERDATYDELKAKLLKYAEEKCCRYAVFDLKFEFKGAEKEKIMFIAWSPENAMVKQKMVYTSSKDYLKKALQLTYEVQATDADEISLENVTEKAARGMKD